MSKFGEPKQKKKKFDMQKFFAWSRKNFSKIVGIIILILALFIGFFVYQNISSTYTGTEISVTQETYVIDVRTFNDFNVQHLERAMNMDYSSGGFLNYLDQLDKNKPYVVYGYDDTQSGEAVKVFEKQKFKHVTDGGSMETASKKTGLNIIRYSNNVPTGSATPAISATPTASFTPIMVSPTSTPSK